VMCYALDKIIHILYCLPALKCPILVEVWVQ
jgi:hypothetical protein